MAKKKPAPSTDEAEAPGRYSVVIDPQLVPKIKIIAAALATNGHAWVNSRLAEIVDRELETALARMGFRREG
jgi:hypothetical protein